MPRRQEEIALRDRAGSRAHAFGALRQRLEIHMRGEVGLPGALSGSAKACLATACSVSPRPSGHDRSRSPARRRRMLTRRPSSIATLSVRHSKIAPSGALRKPRGSKVSKMRDRIARGGEAEIAGRRDVDQALVPAVGLFDRLMDRQRVEEFVGEDDAGPAGTSLSARARASARREAPACAAGLPQRRADLDQMQHDRVAETAHTLRRAQRVLHHGAAAGPELDDAQVFRRAHLLPDRRHPQPDHLAEHLADFRRGDEIAAGAERIAVGVIAVLAVGQAQRHVFGDRHRPGHGDAPADFAFQRRRFVMPCFAVGSGCVSANAMKARPARNSGMHSSMPMVSAAPQKAELRVGLAEKFADDARDAVAEAKLPMTRPGRFSAPARTSSASTTNSTRPSSAAS